MMTTDHYSPSRQPRSRSPYNSPVRKQTKFYLSPRIDTPDDQLFPAEVLCTAKERWNYMSKLAGRHRQPRDTLHVNLQRVFSPQALVAGLPASIGSNIQTLHLPLNDASQLPEWLDAISNVFPNLLHLHFMPQNDNIPKKPVSSPKTLSDETLVRRLYVLYRLPNLKSMDGEPFSEQEQKLSRPRDRKQAEPESPKQQPPEAAAKEVNVSCLLDESSDEEDIAANNLEVEIGLNGKPVPCDPDRWEYASVESSAVACEWGCGISSLPYFQRSSKQLKRNRLVGVGKTPQQTAMHLNQFTFEDSIEIDTSASSEGCRIPTPPSETQLEHHASPISSSSSHSKSHKSNQENVEKRAPPIRSLTSPFPMQFRSARGVTERVEKLIGAISEDSEPSECTRDTIDTHRPIPLSRIQSSPSNLGPKAPSSKKNRPPPCPGRRAPLGSRPQRARRRPNRWRERLTARSNSIFDDEEDDDDDDDDDEDNGEDSDKLDEDVVALEPKGFRLT